VNAAPFGLTDLILMIAFMAIPVLLWRVSSRASRLVRVVVRLFAVLFTLMVIWNTVSWMSRGRSGSLEDSIVSVTVEPADSRGSIHESYYISYEFDWLALAGAVFVVLGLGWAFNKARSTSRHNPH
jgi:hypothetical protein